MPEQENPIYRVGNHQSRNIYRGDEYIGVMFDPADAAMIAEVLNEKSPEPARIQDYEGDWFARQPDGTYRMEGGGGAVWTRDDIVTSPIEAEDC